MEPYQYIIAIIGGFFAGVINTLAGNGSAITLTILMEIIGLNATAANATNRIGVMAQAMAGSYAFYKNGKLDMSKSWVYIVPTVIGAIAGIIVSIWVSAEAFRNIFRFIMVLMLGVVLVKPKRWLQKTDTNRNPNIWITFPLFLALGFYGGFIQMGMGIFFLAAMVLGAKYSIIDGNAVKIFALVIYTFFAVAIFQYEGLIVWKIGLVLASGQFVGGWLTAQYASKYEQANVWAYRLLIVVVILAIIKLFNLHQLVFS